MKVTASKLNSFQRLTSPPGKSAGDQSLPVDSVTFSSGNPEADAPITYQPSWTGARPKDTKARMTGFQAGALILGSMAALAGVFGVVALSGPTPTSRPSVEAVKETQQRTESEVELAAPIAETREVRQEARFEDGRELLVSRPGLVGAQKFLPDPSQAIAQRGNFTTYSEEYIDSLVNRNLTEVPTGQPSFTAHGVDPGQSSKLYFDAQLQPTDWGYGAVRSGDFFTRPTRMKQGNGLRDEITQHQISAVYRLEERAEMDGVTLEPGLYRLITLEASSRVATPSMHRSVAPGHRLVPTGSGFANDFKPVQTDEAGRPLKVNPEDIVQVWTLTAEEAAQYNQ